MGIIWTFGRKLALGFAIAILIIAVVGISGYRSTAYLIENDALVEHTYKVRMTLSILDTYLKDAETAQRGYVITGDPAFLAPYEAGAPKVVPTFDELKALTSDNPRQQARFNELRPLIDARMAEMKRIIELRRAGGEIAATEAVGQKIGQGLMVRLLRIMADIDVEEAQLLEARAAAASQSSDWAKASILWGSLLGTSLIIAVAIVISRSLTQQIGAAVSHIQASSTELQTAANQQATGAKEQSTAMNEITTTISELLATSRQIAENARRVSEIADQTTRASRSGEQTVSKGNDAVNTIRRQVDLIVNHMVDLGKKSQRIGSVLDIVSELSEQTNILAINATIEAAGAGDAGRRFGVVADEIRKLADRVGGSTKEIRILIDDIRSAVNTSIMTTETGSKAAEAGADQFAIVARSFSQINEQVTTTTEAAKEIELSTKQQASAVEQVNVAITNVAQAAKESEVSTGQTLRTAAELSHLSRELLQLVQPKDASSRSVNA